MKRPYIICIVDDDDVYKFTVTKTLELQKVAKKNILVFSDGEEALEFLLENIANTHDMPDIIFLDINMPIMDGWQFLDEYIKLKPMLGKKITVYMVSSSVDQADIRRAKMIPEISDYIFKPIKSNQLSEIMEKLENA